MFAGDPLVCQELPHVENIFWLIVGQRAPIPIGSVQFHEKSTFIAERKKSHQREKPHIFMNKETKKAKVLIYGTKIAVCPCN